jgi:threonine aldolase
LTEYGTLYSYDEILALGKVARKNNLFFHVDGSRISNAAIGLGRDFREFTRDAGVDILSFGGTKNGMMFGEAILIFNKELSESFSFLRKQGMQLHSKMRFISAQFEAYLSNDLWKRNATHSNNMAQRLERSLLAIPQVRITQTVDGNGVFAIIPREIVPELQKEVFFYVWNEELSEARLMCSFDTKEEEIDRFAARLRELLS